MALEIKRAGAAAAGADKGCLHLMHRHCPAWLLHGAGYRLLAGAAAEECEGDKRPGAQRLLARPRCATVALSMMTDDCFTGK
ncbi:hypothetical protein AcidC75_21980 [Acidisoma sp. C75]